MTRVGASSASTDCGRFERSVRFACSADFRPQVHAILSRISLRRLPTLPRSARARPPFTVGLALLLLAGACAGNPAVRGTGPVPQFQAGGSPADSAAVLAVVGTALQTEQVQRVADRFYCGARATRCVELDGWKGTWTPGVSPLLGELAQAAGAELVRPGRRPSPPCPWIAVATEPVGYFAVLPLPIIAGDSAVVHVRLTCKDAHNTSTRAPRHERKYSLARGGATWRIVATSLTRSR
jgi:hypothetical protein